MSRAPSASATRAVVALLALLCTGLGFVVGRQQSAAPPQAPTFVEQLDAALDLSPEQVAELDRLLTDEDRAIEALVEQHRSQLREPVAARLQRIEDVMLGEILDEQQQARYRTLLAASTEHR